MDIRDFLLSRWATAFLLIMLVLIMFVTAKLLLQKREVENEIAKLDSRVQEINKDNQELSELIKYLNTPEYAERQAREKLNLKKEGEQVVVLPPTESEGNVAGISEESIPNYKRWYNYFFGDKL